jgi:hypothetical protein
MPKKKDITEEQKPKVHPELEGFEIKIDKFGKMHSSLPIEKLNEFLDRNVEDKKFRNIEVERSSKKDK